MFKIHLRGLSWALIIWLLFFAGILVCAIWLQSLIVINHDNFTLLQVTQKFLNGGRYFYNFIDVNPPMILFVYTPPVIFSKSFHLDIYALFRIYIFLIALFVLMLCAYLLKASQEFNKTTTRIFILLVLQFIFLALFPVSLGQREQLTLMLIIPYLILANIRCQKEYVSGFMAVLVGVLTAIGLGFKPQFLIPVLFVELFLMVRNKKFFFCFRPEIVSMGLVLLLYLTVIVVFTPEYLSIIVPLISSVYYYTYIYSLGSLLVYLPFVFFTVSALSFFIFYQSLHHKTLSSILVVASLGFVVVYFMQGTKWEYHFLPAYGLVVLLDCLMLSGLLSEMFQRTQARKDFSSLKAIGISGLIGFLLFSPIQSISLSVHKESLTNYRQEIQRLKRLVDQYGDPQRSVFLLSPYMTDRMMLIKYAHANIHSRFDLPLYLLVGINHALRMTDKKDRATLRRKKKLIVSLIADDLQKASPSLIFYTYNAREKDVSSKIPRLLLINDLLQNKQFLDIAERYQYLARTKRFVVFYKVKSCNNHPLEMSDKFFQTKFGVKINEE